MQPQILFELQFNTEIENYSEATNGQEGGTSSLNNVDTDSKGKQASNVEQMCAYLEPPTEKKILRKPRRKAAKSNKQLCREYRARKKALKSIAVSEEESMQAPPLLETQFNTEIDNNPEATSGQGARPNSGVTVDSEPHIASKTKQVKSNVEQMCAFRKPPTERKILRKPRKTPAKSNKQVCREYRARKKALKSIAISEEESLQAPLLLETQINTEIDNNPEATSGQDTRPSSRLKVDSEPDIHSKTKQVKSNADQLYAIQKTPAEEKISRNPRKTPAKSNKQLCREYRARKKALKSITISKESKLTLPLLKLQFNAETEINPEETSGQETESSSRSKVDSAPRTDSKTKQVISNAEHMCSNGKPREKPANSNKQLCGEYRTWQKTVKSINISVEESRQAVSLLELHFKT